MSSNRFPFLYIMLVLAVSVGYLTLFTIWTDRNLDYSVSYFKGYEVDVPMWLSFLVAIIGDEATFLFNIICELTRL